MKYSAAPLIAVTAVLAAATTINATKPMLRASIISLALEDANVYGSIDGQIVLQGAGITHGLTRSERRQVSSCFINAYNDAHASVGYQADGIRVTMTHYHNGTTAAAMTTTNLADTTTAAAADTATIPTAATVQAAKKRPYNALMMALDWSCSFCAPSIALSSISSDDATTSNTQQVGDLPGVPPLNDDFLGFFQDCLATTGYHGVDEVNVGFFVPTLTTYLDPVVSPSDNDATPSAAVSAAAAAIAAKLFAKESVTANTTVMLSNTNSESDLFLYGLTAELLPSDVDVIAQCYIASYNKIFQGSDWKVEFFTLLWQTVIGSRAMLATSQGYSYLLMDASIFYACKTCNGDDKPDLDPAKHNSFANKVFTCLSNSKANAFGGLESLEIRNLVGSSSSNTLATVVGTSSRVSN